MTVLLIKKNHFHRFLKSQRLSTSHREPPLLSSWEGGWEAYQARPHCPWAAALPLVMPLALLVLGALGWDFAAIGP